MKIAEVLGAPEKVWEREIRTKGKDGKEFRQLQYYEDGEWHAYDKMTERHFRIAKL